MYASSWFLTLFLTTFPLPVATRVFDIFMYEVRTPNTPSSSGGLILAKEGTGLGEGSESSLGEQDQRCTVTAAFAGPGDCVPGGPRLAAGEPDGADAAGHGGHVPGGPGAQGRLGSPRPPPRAEVPGQAKLWGDGGGSGLTEHSNPFPSSVTPEASLEGQGGPEKPQALSDTVQGQQPDSEKRGRPRPWEIPSPALLPPAPCLPKPM